MNDKQAREALSTYDQAYDEMNYTFNIAGMDTVMVDLLSDLHHVAAGNGQNWYALLLRADDKFQEETGDDT